MLFLKAGKARVALSNKEAAGNGQGEATAKKLSHSTSATPSPGNLPQPEFSATATKTGQSTRRIEKWLAGSHRNAADFLSPGQLAVEQNLVRVGEIYYAHRCVYNLPRKVEPGWLKPLLTLNIPHEIDFFVETEDNRIGITRLQKHKKNLYSTVLQDTHKGRLTVSEVEVALKDLDDLIIRLQSGLDRLARLSILVTTWATSRRQLREQLTELSAVVTRCGVESRSMSFRQLPGYRTLLPDGQNLTRAAKLTDATTLAFSFPFLSSSLNMEGGVLWGINLDENSPVFVNPWNRDYLPNPNIAVLGTPGCGKSFFLKMLAIRLLSHGVKFKCIDPENEYGRLAEECGGRSVSISASRPVGFNLLELPADAEGHLLFDSKTEGESSEPLSEKIISIKPFLEMMLLGTRRGADPGICFDPRQDALVEKALFETYENCGITREAIARGLNARELNRATEAYAGLIAGSGGVARNRELAQNFDRPRIPTLADLRDSLADLREPYGLAENLERFVSGAYAGFFSPKPSVFRDDDYLTVFKIREVSREMEPLVIALVMIECWNQAVRKREPLQFACDELWSLLATVAGGSFVATFARRSRKHGLSLVVATQQVADFIGSEHGRAVLACCATKWIGKQQGSREELMAALEMDQPKIDFVRQAATGQALLKCNDRWTRLQVCYSPLEYAIAETNPRAGMLAVRQGADSLN
ncbi:MAG TPA: DUF87 domain-containing protein [Chloroflexia bacterium]|nr:DUF87 domain-containing protein [Chloroflexia bacterium]